MSRLHFLLLIVVLLPVVVLTGGARAQGSLLLVGGGSEAPGGYAWFIDHAPNNRVVVLDYADNPDSSIPGRLADEGAEVTYLPISSRVEADDPANRDAVLAADGVFLPGGDQWRYISRWKGTLIEEALQSVFDRGGVLGGTSAGAMVLSGVVFDAQNGSFSSREALLDPTTSYISLTDDFLSVLPDALVDTHFDERGRLGRLLAMLANYHAASGRWVTGIGLAYGTALAVTPDGVGEVLGGGTVALLYPTDRTGARVEAGQPLSLSDLRLVQLSEEYRADVSTGEVVEAPDTAEPFMSVPFVAPTFPAVLDGSSEPDVWLAAGGSVETLGERVGPEALMCVVSLPGAAEADAVAVALAAAGRPVLRVGLDAESQDDSNLASAVGACEAQVWVGNELDEVAGYAGPGTAVGSALRDRLAASTPALFLGTDARTVGLMSVLNTENRCDASYQGSLELEPALHLISGLTVMPLAFDTSSCHWENQITGMMWGVAQSRSAYGVLLAEGSTFGFEAGVATMMGAVPALILDARAVETVDYPVRRNNPTLVNAFLHVLADGEAFDFASPLTVSEPVAEAQRKPRLVAYPNPTTGPASLLFDAGPGGPTTVAVYDVLGREVIRRDLGRLPAGEARAALDLSGLSGGVYIIRLRMGAAVQHRAITLATD